MWVSVVTPVAGAALCATFYLQYRVGRLSDELICLQERVETVATIKARLTVDLSHFQPIEPIRTAADLAPAPNYEEIMRQANEAVFPRDVD